MARYKGLLLAAAEGSGLWQGLRFFSFDISNALDKTQIKTDFNNDFFFFFSMANIFVNTYKHVYIYIFFFLHKITNIIYLLVFYSVH